MIHLVAQAVVVSGREEGVPGHEQAQPEEDIAQECGIHAHNTDSKDPIRHVVEQVQPTLLVDWRVLRAFLPFKIYVFI